MPARPAIGVTCGTLRGPSEPAYGVNQAYVTALQQAGGAVILIPPAQPDELARLVERLDALLLPGGADVDAALYHEPPGPKMGDVDRPRDASEQAALRAAIDLRKPVLGICRGQQFINVALGGSLYQDLVSDLGPSFDHHTEPELGRQHELHRIEIEPRSRLAHITGERQLKVNSFHHQGVKEVAPGLQVSARSPDGIVEGLESPDGLILAVQSHPEELLHRDWARALFQALIEAAGSGSFGPASL